MKTKGLIFVSCLATAALMASPAMAKPAKKSSMSSSKRVAPKTTQMTRHNQNMSTRMGNTGYYGTRSYAGRQTTGTRYYGGTHYYSNGNYYGGGGGARYYSGGGYAYPNYGYYSGWPSSNWGYATSGYYPYSYYGGYPYGSYTNRYSYYTPTYSYSGSTVAAVQQRLGRLGYYHGAVDGVIGPQTRNAIAAFQSRNGMAVDGAIDRPLLNSLGLA